MRSSPQEILHTKFLWLQPNFYFVSKRHLCLFDIHKASKASLAFIFLTFMLSHESVKGKCGCGGSSHNHTQLLVLLCILPNLLFPNLTFVKWIHFIPPVLEDKTLGFRLQQLRPKHFLPAALEVETSHREAAQMTGAWGQGQEPHQHLLGVASESPMSEKFSEILTDTHMIALF